MTSLDSNSSEKRNYNLLTPDASKESLDKKRDKSNDSSRQNSSDVTEASQNSPNGTSLSPAPLIFDVIDASAPKKKRKKKHKKIRKESTEKSIKRRRVRKNSKNAKMQNDLPTPQQVPSTPRPTSHHHHHTHKNKSVDDALNAKNENLPLSKGKNSRSNNAFVLPKRKKNDISDSKSQFVRIKKKSRDGEYKSVRTSRRRVRSKKVDHDLDNVVATPVIDVQGVISMSESTKAGLNLLTDGLVPTPVDIAEFKAEKPLPLQTMADVDVTVDGTKNEFTSKTLKRKKSKKSLESKSSNIYPISKWYPFQIDVINAPDDTKIEEKATKDFDLLDLIKRIKE